MNSFHANTAACARLAFGAPPGMSPMTCGGGCPGGGMEMAVPDAGAAPSLIAGWCFTGSSFFPQLKAAKRTRETTASAMMARRERRDMSCPFLNQSVNETILIGTVGSGDVRNPKGPAVPARESALRSCFGGLLALGGGLSLRFGGRGLRGLLRRGLRRLRPQGAFRPALRGPR